ncbi:jg22860, partial [Pararge aegeria aegeria]
MSVCSDSATGSEGRFYREGAGKKQSSCSFPTSTILVFAGEDAVQRLIVCSDSIVSSNLIVRFVKHMFRPPVLLRVAQRL